MDAKQKLINLKQCLRQLKSVAIAFSGGVDSTFLAKVCKDVLNENAICITINTAFQPKSEIDEARKLAKNIGTKHIIIDLSINDLKSVKANPIDRCYKCKKIIFSKIKEEALKHGISTIVDGSNMDDTKDYRPGMKALKELNVISPLLEAGLTKQDIRVLSKQLGLETWKKSSMSCLAARVPYNEEITEKKLSMIEEAEEYLKYLGFNQFRVRHHNTIARIEVLPEDMNRLLDKELKNKISVALKDIGFKYICLDLEGYKTGSLNREIGN
ncbi:ATP-dependent sacrificial sulfur transferase LarE [Abyssisolibacter fermentans]|uniref:ATP-dependent sacrificial sulfur transferase LarE n=1 Tax=Abyssisolibacter fermentans TaxID=1766203 RepID=UPI00082F9F9A|nr:ATP-dependent sacrificial sulfur transferase LarE [Abyssisolibacter fermentans]